MNKKNLKKVARVKRHINKVFPHANDVDIKVQKLPKEGFKSLIRIKAPKKKTIIAVKIDSDIERSLEKSHQAVVKQIHKLKTKWNKRGEPHHNSLHLVS